MGLNEIIASVQPKRSPNSREFSVPPLALWLLVVVLIFLALWAYLGWLSYQWQNDAVLHTIRGDAATRENVRVQQDMAEFSYGTFLYSAFGFAVSMIGVAFVAYTVTQNRMMIKETREIGQNETKAYVFSESAAVTMPEGDSPIVIRVKLRNVGATPATKLSISGTLRAPLITAGGPPLSLSGGAAMILVENGELVLVAERKPFDEWLGSRGIDVDRSALPVLMLAGCIAYHDVFAERYETTFYSNISFKQVAEGNPDITLSPGDAFTRKPQTGSA